MGRPRKFNREDILKKSLPIFWSRGFADTVVQDLEKATGVNKSGLYSEFKDKEEIFVESLRYYFSTACAGQILTKEPLGLKNIEQFFLFLVNQPTAPQKGCFGVNCMRELDVLPEEARDLVAQNRKQLRQYFIKNLNAEKTKTSPEVLADLLMTFFSGFCIEQNIKNSKAAALRKVEELVGALRAM